MNSFLQTWGEAAMTSLGFFWMAFWAFCLGYLISSMIQVFVTTQRMRETMGEAGPKSVALGTLFGFISSSCSFAALSTSRALFQKGAGLVPALAFLLASTNLVIELGILIFVFLSWQFVVGEYVGGLILILIMWLVVKLTLPKNLAERAREIAEQFDLDDGEKPDPVELMKSETGWLQVVRRYGMEWNMVWKDVLFGFTVAGIIAAFVPPEFFQAMFIGSQESGGPTWWQTVLHTLIGPAAAFFTFIGSMGNIPLAAILFGSGVSFAGVMAFIFSDLVVFPVLRISSQYFGWRMAIYILGVFLICLVSASLILHYGFTALDMVPDASAVSASQTEPMERFKVDYTLFFNLGFGLLSALALIFFRVRGESKEKGEGSASWVDRVLLVLACGSIFWLVGGVSVFFWHGA